MGRPRRVTARGRTGPIVLLPALFFLCFAVAWRLADRRPRPSRPFGEPSDAAGHLAPAEVEGFEGRLVLPDPAQGRLSARLVPLQALPQWQAFDALALARRLDLAPGEPWRLELLYEATDGGAARLDVDLTVARIEAADGSPLLAPITVADALAAEAPSDPLRTLFRARSGALRDGVPAGIVLWGRAPDGAPRFVAGDLALALEPVRVQAKEIRRSIARLETGPAPVRTEAR